MSKREKAIEKLRQNPKNVRFEEIVTILTRLGFVMRQDGTSHALFTLGNHIINIPRRKPFIKPKYIEFLIEELDRMLETDSPED